MFKYIRKKKEQAAWLNNKREHTYIEFDKINSIMIFFNYEDLKLVMPIARDMVRLKKKVFLWTTSPVRGHSSKIYDSSGQGIRVLTQEDKSFLLVVTNRTLKEFKLLQYDLLLDLTQQDDDVLLYMALNNKSKFSIGLREPTYPIHDFIYLKENEQDFSEAFEDMKNYLSRYVVASE